MLKIQAINGSGKSQPLSRQREKRKAMASQTNTKFVVQHGAIN
jgi:hypothetical protein